MTRVLIDLSEVKRRLREAVEQSGRDHDELIRESGVSRSVFYRSLSERSRVGIRLDVFARLCQALGASSDDVLGIRWRR